MGAVRILNALNRADVQARLFQAGVNDLHQGLVAVPNVAAAAQDNRVAGLQAQGGNVQGYVGPGFVDDADHANGDASVG